MISVFSVVRIVVASYAFGDQHDTVRQFLSYLSCHCFFQ